MKKFNLAVAIGAIALTLTACGGGDDNGKVTPSQPSLEGHYQGTTIMNDYEVTSDFDIDDKGNVIGVSFTDFDDTSNPNPVLTVVKGKTDGSRLYEFDLIDKKINKYNASATKQTSKRIIFKFSNVPSGLTRPKTLVARTIMLEPHGLQQLIGTYNSVIIDIDNRFEGVLEIAATNNPSVLTILNTENGDGCQLTGTITRQPNQPSLSDIEGTFTGSNCGYAGKKATGHVQYSLSDNNEGIILIYAATTDNTNAFVLLN